MQRCRVADYSPLIRFSSMGGGGRGGGEEDELAPKSS